MKKNNCLVCGNKKIKDILDLGKTSLANNLISFKDKDLKDKKYPLVLGQCNSCLHVQLKYIVKPKLMFDKYLYLSSASSTLTQHLSSIPHAINKLIKINKNDTVIDIGSNDGSLLKGYKKFNVKCIAVEPAKNLRKYYKNTSIINYTNYFDENLAKKIAKKHGKPKIITATNVFPHIQNLEKFCKSLKILMEEKSVFVFEAHYLLNLLQDAAFDTIYHEHVSYWSITAAQTLFEKHGLELFKVDKLNIHHGQIRCWVAKKNTYKIDKKLTSLIKYENMNGRIHKKGLSQFKKKVMEIKYKIGKLLQEQKKIGKKVVGYGAPAKASTLITFLNIKKDLLPYIVDKNPLKQNCYIPGARIPIYPVKKIYEEKPDFLINFAWNFIDEIKAQNKRFLKKGGKIINPIPKLQIIK